MTTKIASSANDETHFSVEAALTRIIELSKNRSLSDKRLRSSVLGFARSALEQIELGKQAGVDVLANPVEDLPVAWLHVWSGHGRAIKKTLADDRYGLSEAIPLTFFPNGEVVAWRWADGGGYNADYRYSFVDPREDYEEVEAQGAESVTACKPLYVHPLAKGYKA